MTSPKPKNLQVFQKIYKNIFRFINDLNSFETNLKLFIFKFYPEEPEVSKENIDKGEVNFSDLGIKVRDGKFKVGLPDKGDSFIF